MSLTLNGKELAIPGRFTHFGSCMTKNGSVATGVSTRMSKAVDSQAWQGHRAKSGQKTYFDMRLVLKMITGNLMKK